VESEIKGIDESTKATILSLLISGRLLDCGELYISKSTLGKKREGLRYLIYLHSNRGYLWKLLNERKIKVRVYIELLEGLSNQ
jgi:homoserine dehydrogenase